MQQQQQLMNVLSQLLQQPAAAAQAATAGAPAIPAAEQLPVHQQLQQYQLQLQLQQQQYQHEQQLRLINNLLLPQQQQQQPQAQPQSQPQAQVQAQPRPLPQGYQQAQQLQVQQLQQLLQPQPVSLQAPAAAQLASAEQQRLLLQQQALQHHLQQQQYQQQLQQYQQQQKQQQQQQYQLRLQQYQQQQQTLQFQQTQQSPHQMQPQQVQYRHSSPQHPQDQAATCAFSPNGASSPAICNPCRRLFGNVRQAPSPAASRKHSEPPWRNSRVPSKEDQPQQQGAALVVGNLVAPNSYPQQRQNFFPSLSQLLQLGSRVAYKTTFTTKPGSPASLAGSPAAHRSASSPLRSPSPSVTSQSPTETPRTPYFSEWLSPEEIQCGLTEGSLAIGTLSVSNKHPDHAFVSVDDFERDVIVEGFKARNRAIDGDVVVVQLLPSSKWKQDIQDEADVTSADTVDADVTPEPSLHAEGDASPTPETAAVSNEALSPAELVQLAGKPGQGLRPVGVVVAVQQRMRPAATPGFICPQSGSDFSETDDYAEFRPLDRRLPLGMAKIRDIAAFLGIGVVHGRHIPESSRDQLRRLASQLCVAEYQPWVAAHSRPPVRLLSEIGDPANVEAATTAILMQSGIDSNPFSDDIMQLCTQMTTHLDAMVQKELRSRRDLRGTRIFSIDPVTSKDMDDALSCVSLEDGNFEVGVHIADVSFFVPPGSALDRVACERSTSVYLVQQVIPMLPLLLSDQLCSIMSGVDRLAVSAIWKLSPQGDVLSEWFGRTVIHSCSKMSYDVAQAILEGRITGDDGWGAGKCVDALFVTPELGPFAPATSVRDLVADVKNMYSIAAHLRKSREKLGSMFLDTCKLWFKLREDGTPVSCQPYVCMESNNLVEEYMLLANQRIALRIASYFPEIALLRCHPPPDEAKVKRLSDLLETHELGSLDCGSSQSLMRSLQACTQRCGARSQALADTVKLLAVRTMKAARYFCSGTVPVDEWHHFSLNCEFYTHFTSPIRRYADVVVHRLLLSSVAMEAAELDLLSVGDNAPSGQPTSAELTAICSICNNQKKVAKLVQDATIKAYLCLLYANPPPGTPTMADAVVLGLGARGFLTVFVPLLGIEAKIFLREETGVRRFSWDKRAACLTVHWSDEPAPEVSQRETAVRCLIDHCFGDDNLQRDRFLMQEMCRRPDGGVAVSTIAVLPKIVALTRGDTELLLRAAASASRVQLSEDKQFLFKRSAPQTPAEKQEATPAAEPAHAATETISVFSIVPVALRARSAGVGQPEIVVELLHPALRQRPEASTAAVAAGARGNVVFGLIPDPAVD
eukprot:TRINITY_DN6464_c0_g1_i1.p1 TRINITY_DN6464_c0_g1~~TRINITY_DN6464_c0_g1_i1.p1  ORF type:complete len:1328 (-),score=329.80 TRINITY_DN6464_c0_g1_i1:2143-6081(-)